MIVEGGCFLTRTYRSSRLWRLDIMDEDKNQDKEPVGRALKEGAPEEKKVSPKNKIGNAFSDMYRLFTKSKSKGDKAAGDPKSAREIKETTVLKPAAFGAQKINLKIINQTLIVFLAGLMVLLFYVSLREKREVSSVVAAIAKIKLPEVEPKTVVSFKELPYYLDQIRKRDIFSVFQEKRKEPAKVAEPVKTPEPPPPPVVPIEEKAKNIKLIGISWGENPKVMIKNLNTQNVQFVSVGEKIDGTDLEVKEILKSEVVLSSEGQEMSLM